LSRLRAADAFAASVSVDRLHFLHPPLERQIGLDSPARRRGEKRRRAAIRQCRLNGLDERRCAAGAYEQAMYAVRHQLRGAAHVRRDNWRLERHRFEDGIRRPFTNRGLHEQVE
jgi:hypothetical protein